MTKKPKLIVKTESFGELLTKSAKQAAEINKIVIEVENIQEQIINLKDRLREIRSKCEHKNGFSLEKREIRLGSILTQRMCVVCKSFIKGVTQKEIDSFEE